MCSWNRLRVFKGYRYAEVLEGWVLIGGPWDLVIYDKGESTPDLPGQWTLGFWTDSRVPSRLCPSPLILLAVRVGGRDFVSGCSWRLKFSPLHIVWLHGLQFWSVVSEKQLSISLNRIRPFWVGSVGTLLLIASWIQIMLFSQHSHKDHRVFARSQSLYLMFMHIEWHYSHHSRKLRPALSPLFQWVN